ncbi:MAG TPA: hypothetical protein VET66_04505 [Steroidobacteraceae bacterium]|nr:hypothetical protein [Steroidobacteraceae bacterium]
MNAFQFEHRPVGRRSVSLSEDETMHAQKPPANPISQRRGLIALAAAAVLSAGTHAVAQTQPAAAAAALQQQRQEAAAAALQQRQEAAAAAQQQRAAAVAAAQEQRAAAMAAAQEQRAALLQQRQEAAAAAQQQRAAAVAAAQEQRQAAMAAAQQQRQAAMAAAQQQRAAAVAAAQQQRTAAAAAAAAAQQQRTAAAGAHGTAGGATTQPAQAASSKWHLPLLGSKGPATGPSATPAAANPVRRFFDSFNKRGNAAPAAGPAANLSGAAKHAAGPATIAGAAHAADGQVRLASLNSDQALSARTLQSQQFLGHSAPPGTRELLAPNGSTVRRAADGSILDVHNPKSGVYIQHGLDGSRRITVEQPDGSRVFAPAHGTAYVQHPYLFHSQPFDHRTLYQQGQLTHQFYRPYTYAGVNMDVYAPQRFYSPDVYRWAGGYYSAPVRPQWNYVTTPTPWFSYYKGYFTPESSYLSPVGWLTDYVLATSLISAYHTHPGGAGTAPPGPQTAATITPEVKQKVSDEVARQVHRESVEAEENARNKDSPPGTGSVVQELGDHEPHVFVVASDLDLVDPSGRRCMVSEGDVVQVVSEAKPRSGTATSVVLASKGGVECARSAQVEIALSDLQEMQNHMRETIDQGMANSSVGSRAATVAPAYAAAAPAPDANAAREIEQQKEIAAAADG